MEICGGNLWGSFRNVVGKGEGGGPREVGGGGMGSRKGGQGGGGKGRTGVCKYPEKWGEGGLGRGGPEYANTPRKGGLGRGAWADPALIQGGVTNGLCYIYIYIYIYIDPYSRIKSKPF